LAATLQKRPLGALSSAIPQVRTLNAESVTAIVTGFLKRVGNKGVLKPKRVSLEEGVYTVEVEMKKLAAIVKVDAETHEIKEYEVQAKGEETPFISISPKIIIVVAGISAAVHIGLYFALKMFGL
jgi:predicted DNA-binding antitoxin AbrB/MazE fold protein